MGNKQNTRAVVDDVVVSTVAGCDDYSVDGIGTAAGFGEPNYCAVSGDVLLIAETGPHRIRRMFPVAESRNSALNRTLISALIESGALPLHPLISIIYDFTIGNSMKDGSCWRYR